MPKLPTKVSKQVDDADASGGSFEPLPAGKYAARLSEVTAEPHPRFDNVTIWVAVFNEIYTLDGERKAGQQWLRLNVIGDRTMPASYDKGEDKWGKFVGVSDARLKQFFEAMGYTVDSDTDEMLGEPVVMNIGQRTIQQGTRAGELTNEVRGLSPIEDESGLTFDYESESGAGDDSF